MSQIVYSYLYAYRRTEKRKIIYMHNDIMGFIGIDHIDGNGLNNQKSNLRKATNQQNSMNKRKRENTTSKFKGVCLHFRKKWSAQITFNYKKIHLGLFSSEDKAARAYNKKAKELFGEFARLNRV